MHRNETDNVLDNKKHNKISKCITYFIIIVKSWYLRALLRKMLNTATIKKIFGLAYYV